MPRMMRRYVVPRPTTSHGDQAADDKDTVDQASVPVVNKPLHAQGFGVRHLDLTPARGTGMNRPSGRSSSLCPPHQGSGAVVRRCVGCQPCSCDKMY